MKTLKFAIFGTGFWSRFQLAAWRELEGVECVALYNRTLSKAEALGREFGISAVYDDASCLLDDNELDFVDIITDVDTHVQFVSMAASRGLPVICQKPLAPTFAAAQALARLCGQYGTPLYVHENFRWQSPLRALKNLLQAGRIGTPYRAQIDFRSSFPVFDNQPFLRELEQFILTDVGTHILDVARCLFGEGHSVYCHTHKHHKDIRGEDVATVMLNMGEGTSVVCNMSYGAPLKNEAFPQTFVHVEGSKGSIDLERDYRLSVTTHGGSTEERCPPAYYPWMDSAYEVVHSSIVDCHANLVAALRGETTGETTAADNLRTLQLVEAAYQSDRTGEVVRIDPV